MLDRREAAGAVAGAAFDAFALVDEVGLARFAGDAADRAGAAAGAASDALIGQDQIAHQRMADAGAAIAIADMLHILVVEMSQRGERGIGRRLAQPAEAGALDGMAQSLQQLQILHGTVAVGDAREDFQHAFGALAAGGAFPAGFILGEFQKEPRDVHHAVVLIEHDHPAGAHDDAGLYQRVVIDDGIE